jgi:SAM-dependent methyltransferase
MTSPGAKSLSLPFPGARFDLVACRLAAHHFADPAMFVREAWRVLAPGGTLALVGNVSPDPAILPLWDEAGLRDCAIAYKAFEKLRDPSHGRCLGLAEWTRLLGNTGFKLTHSEHMDQDIEFGPWTARMRCDEATKARLKALLRDKPLQKFLRPRETDASTVFTLQESIVLARKPR